jgi:hypothetical protein
MLGKNEEARRKFLERAVRVDSMSPEVKTAAKAAGLGDRPTALVEIASATPEARLAKIEEINERKRKPRQPFDVAAHGELIAKLDAAWESDTGLRPALKAAPLSVATWYVSKRMLASMG